MSLSSQSQSASAIGSVNVEPQDPKSNPNHKREAYSETHDPTAKKSRTEAAGSEEGNSGAVSGQQNAKELTFEIEADAAEDKGSRHTMEDAWVVILDASLDHPGKLRCAHFAIYDGHGGRLAAEYAQKHLHENVLSTGLPRVFYFTSSVRPYVRAYKDS
ncbi:probable protein phosphatase 2C 8 [Prosopis cineraria]|uniref:probable protein phosphatase 2C 8 n=1 Tax=Prosopis cineraria TaxID=364024 RepID=UPI00240F4160|nr:probable protein phosphatase 2C 8 [Prosopis cineraria]